MKNYLLIGEINTIKDYRIVETLPNGDKFIECTVGVIKYFEINRETNNERYDKNVYYIMNSNKEIFCEFRVSNYLKGKKCYLVDLVKPVNIADVKDYVFEYKEKAVYGTEKGEILFIEKENNRIDSVNFEDYSVKCTNIEKFDKNNKLMETFEF